MALITRLVSISFTFLVVSIVHAQELGAGAAALALAHAGAPVESMPFESSNPGAMDLGEGARAAFSVEQAHNLDALRYVSAAATIPLNSAGLGISAETFGFEDFRRFTASLVVSVAVSDRMRLGSRLSYRQVGAPGYPNWSATGVSFGWVLGLRDGLLAGGTWRYAGSTLDPYRTLLQQEVMIGFRCDLGERLRAYGSVLQEAGNTTDIRLAGEAAVSKFFTLRLGTGTNPARVGFGLGIKLSGVSTDVGVSVHPVLGPSIGTTVGLE